MEAKASKHARASVSNGGPLSKYDYFPHLKSAEPHSENLINMVICTHACAHHTRRHTKT